MGHLENLYFYVWISFCLFVCFFNRTPTFFNSIQVYLYCKVTTLYNNAIIRCSVKLKQLTQIEKKFFLVDFFLTASSLSTPPWWFPRLDEKGGGLAGNPFPQNPKILTREHQGSLNLEKRPSTQGPKHAIQ